ncbi:isopentenyl-diphosphate Delta-isomerase [uncultured Arthrobacter sp.]|uniref:isopentenyl-diphosphate Delta-isomerase n=1 Tax=uncultured Arthrobacter sp. TaxID=114050 RepID=UPI0026369A54|nr:isopentenyl-diphosphate Delta-isomerase [uncultured Arthrobacter sp.]
MNRTAELVVLAADDGTPVGTEDKATVHSTSTPLHLAFSAHVYDDAGRILITRRALSKRTWPGVWTNSFCGHPGPDEATQDAVVRRAEHELGLSLDSIELRLPDFRYRAVDASGVVENEICPVYTARAVSPVNPREDEVMEWQWADPLQLTAAVAATPWAFSPWLTLQLPLLYPERFPSPA